MKIPQDHLEAIRKFGYSEPEARFLYVVATHSGYFTQRHFLDFIGQKPGWAVNTFIERLLKSALVKQIHVQNNARVYQLSYKPLYEAIRKENIRNRRDHSLEFAKTRLAILDFVLGHLDHDYLEGEQDKVAYFEKHFQIEPQTMPGRTYKGSNQAPDTTRHFVDKFPIFLDSASDSTQPILTFTFIDPGFENVRGFRLHLEAYSTFLKRLPCFAFVYACPSTRTFHPAQCAFDNLIAPRLTQLVRRVVRYFRLRAAWEAKRYESLSNADLEFLNQARTRYAGHGFESVFANWNAGRLGTRELVLALEKLLVDKQVVTFRTYKLPYDYSAFDQNSQVAKKSAGNRFSERFSGRFSARPSLNFR
jgi:hypothetical protein